jgi:hypothetical protein
MANARKVRDRRMPQTDFEMPLAEAVGLLMRTRDIEPGDTWLFQVDGDTLRIFRSRVPEEIPVEPESNKP